MGLGLVAHVSRNREDEAKPHYERAVQLLRDQIREAGAGGTRHRWRTPEGVNNVLSDLGSMASAVHSLAGILESLGQAQEADDRAKTTGRGYQRAGSAILASQTAGNIWADQFMTGGGSSLRQQNRMAAALDFRLVTILDPDNAEAHNSLAWAMTSVPGQTTPFEIARALDSARKAVELKPKQWMYWNTLGVAAFRAGDWKLGGGISREIHRSQ